MSWHDVWNVLKWVLAALVAGFIGQFGKSLALHLLKRRKQRQQEKAGPQAPTSGSAPSQTSADQALADAQARSDEARASALAKIEKKRAKAEVKRLKKEDKS
jgi:hypothetical protein